jgi:hypothetical protein
MEGVSMTKCKRLQNIALPCITTSEIVKQERTTREGINILLLLLWVTSAHERHRAKQECRGVVLPQ